ncbi:hypothetical protein COO60DRAFT_1187506 [Scenedesmus sp. NREL 46B-D3]|nr:hypothetical protein COO60DRAFT_1187506 [Scenedesmus sp. NREL 46B-D3]
MESVGPMSSADKSVSDAADYVLHMQGLSILARKQQPGYVLPFLHILQSVAAGATAEAAASQAAVLEQTQQCIAAARTAGLFEKADEDSGWGDDGDAEQDATAAAGQGGGGAADTADSPAARYFNRRLQRQAARSLRSAVLAASVLSAALEALAAASRALDDEEMLFERLVAREPDAALKPARPAPVKLLPAVHAAWPLLLAALQDTCSVALLEQGLALMCSMMQLAGGRFMARRFKQEAWPLLMRLAKQGPQGGASALAAAAAAGTTGGAASAAALLGVGQGPGGLTPGLGRSGSGSVQQAGVMQVALRSLEAAAPSSSGWNEVQQGLALASSSGGLQEDDTLAPATLQRVQVAVLSCLQGLCSSAAAAPAMQGPLVWDACMLAAPYLADGQALPLREAAAKLLLAAAQVDADVVWLVLFDLGSCHQDLEQLLRLSAEPQAAPAGDATAIATSRSGLQAGLRDAEGSAAGRDKLAAPPLPKLQQLLPRAAVKQGSGDSGSLQRLLCGGESASCGKRAAALLPRVAQLPVAWHARAEQQLLQLQSASVL